MAALIECVPNFSEGRDKARVDAIVAAMKRDGVYLLDCEMDADHNRSVVTLVGEREPLLAAVLAGIGKATELIDLNLQRGAHPRLGATDVVPFIPIEGATLEDCVQMARELGQQVWQRYQIPVYFYEAAATRPERVNLENIRRGQFEVIREEIANPGVPPSRRGRSALPSHGGRGSHRRAQIPGRLQRLSANHRRGDRQEDRQGGALLQRRIPRGEGHRAGGSRAGAGLHESDRHRRSPDGHGL